MTTDDKLKRLRERITQLRGLGMDTILAQRVLNEIDKLLAEPSPQEPAPTPDAEMEDAMWRYRDCAISVGQHGDGHGIMAERGECLRALIARRVAEAEARGAAAAQDEIVKLSDELADVRAEKKLEAVARTAAEVKLANLRTAAAEAEARGREAATTRALACMEQLRCKTIRAATSFSHLGASDEMCIRLSDLDIAIEMLARAAGGGT